MKGPAKSLRCPPHEPSGFECLVGHGDGKGQCPQCEHCQRFYRPGEEEKAIEIEYCDNCKKREAVIYTGENYSKANAGWRCGWCYVREPQTDASGKKA